MDAGAELNAARLLVFSGSYRQQKGASVPGRTLAPFPITSIFGGKSPSYLVTLQNVMSNNDSFHGGADLFAVPTNVCMIRPTNPSAD
jgi:hypothetical protein